MKVHLITLAAFPYTSAESIHLAMFSKAMANSCQYTLITPLKPWRKMTWSKSLDKFYGINDNCFQQKKIFQFSRTGKDFVEKALKFSIKEHALVYARQYIVMFEACKKGLNCVWEIHSLPSISQLKQVEIFISNGLLKNIVVISSALKFDIISNLDINYNYDNIFIVAPDAADETKFSPKDQISDKPVVGYIGSAYKGKGAEIIFPLATSCPNIKFLFYGVEYGQKEIEYLGIPPSNLELKGKILYSEIPDALNNFDIALLPNQPNVIVANGDNIGKYTSPMKLFEYMASGKAIISSDLDILKEVLVNNRNAILVDYKDVNAWKIELEKLYINKDLRLRLGLNAYQDFITSYTYKARAKNILLCLSEKN
ncbi:glycosyltransferase [Acinetobacter sp. YH12041]|uniref:glycosyltransferase family protein n=1 Tax=Acinetobacter sp. YH12041 TaxID=2601049 RepID=UPI0015D1419D|nr:glycosyltransferase [Acinetobacter sp. YH12041]